MAFLKLREVLRAEADASCALSIVPDHVKSLLRRAGARTALGKHRAALLDLMAAQATEPSNKSIAAEIMKAKELLKQIVSRAPLVPVNISYGALLTEELEAGPELPF